MQFLIIALLSLPLMAKEMKVSYNNKNYVVNFDKSQVTYKDSLTDLSIKKEKCNEYILNTLNNRLEVMTSKYLSKVEKSDSYQVNVDQIKYYIEKSSSRAILYSDFYEYFAKLKTESLISCGKLDL